MPRHLTRTVWLLSLVSLFTDMASEMLYPVMPVYLRTIGFSVAMIGLLEGIAEAVAGLSKGYFGGLSDRSGKRLPFIRGGYALSALSKPMMALFTQAAWVFIARTADRLGKGLRTGARDALLSSESRSASRASVFGFHRAMDTLGAVIGPSIALGFLYFFPGAYKSLFLLATIPGLLAIGATLLLKENTKPPATKKQNVSLLTGFRFFRQASPAFRQLASVLLVFGAVNSSDLLLILRMRESGATDQEVIGLYIFYNLVYALLAYPAGRIADRVGLKKIFLLGLICFILTYAGFAFNRTLTGFILLFCFYGLYAAATEGVSKAWLSRLLPPDQTATGIGTYAGFQSIAALLASSLAGLLWYRFGPETTFLLSAFVTAILAVYLFRSKTLR